MKHAHTLKISLSIHVVCSFPSLCMYLQLYVFPQTCLSLITCKENTYDKVVQDYWQHNVICHCPLFLTLGWKLNVLSSVCTLIYFCSNMIRYSTTCTESFNCNVKQAISTVTKAAIVLGNQNHTVRYTVFDQCKLENTKQSEMNVCMF